jgi:hypothetical protein
MNGREATLLGILGIALAGFLYSLTDSGKTFFTDVANSAGNLFVNRGIRNCNPGNVRRTGTVWKNSYSTQVACEAAGRVWDPDFVVFYTFADGERAIGHILSSYLGRGLNTVSLIISTWAPASDDNDTEGYTNEVSSDVGIAPETLVDSSYIPSLAAAIMKRETGYVEDPDTLFNAVYS